MDCGANYILMCEKAVEIQQTWIPVCYDSCLVRRTYYGEKDEYYLLYVSHPDKIITVIRRDSTDTCIWLPRQDQLQDMVEKIKDKNHFVFRFQKFLQEKYLKITEQPAFVVLENTFDNGVSMEQLWLAFVMSERFEKVWNGEDWIKEG